MNEQSSFRGGFDTALREFQSGKKIKSDGDGGKITFIKLFG